MPLYLFNMEYKRFSTGVQSATRIKIKILLKRLLFCLKEG